MLGSSLVWRGDPSGRGQPVDGSPALGHEAPRPQVPRQRHRLKAVACRVSPNNTLVKLANRPIPPAGGQGAMSAPRRYNMWNAAIKPFVEWREPPSSARRPGYTSAERARGFRATSVPHRRQNRAQQFTQRRAAHVP